ncbi:B-cell receptor CD22-like [Paralichthys olivaceus]|uniref:B-cell receptor CD22-like n=1 Tax=Paralichthys olivaceus TaxID=8255 RepID=UPI003753700C
MLLRGAECVFMGFILYISGVRANSICALKGSSVDLHCSAKRPKSTLKWFTVHWKGNEKVLNQTFADGKHVNISEESNFTLTINDLRESDKTSYCCSDKESECPGREIQLLVADLQVKVLPARGEKTVSLMCSSSCPLTESPANYIWYKNREFLYHDWSPWYQELISSEEADTYSCALKGYEHLRAPEVSVDSLTSACFTVTYATGRMCSFQQRPEDKPCSITYPRELHVQKTEAKNHFKLACNTSCPLTEAQTITWYKNRELDVAPQSPVLSSSPDIYSCAVEDLLSDEVCVQNCLRVSYVNRRICALGGSSVNISSEYSDPYNQTSKSKLWYKKRRSDVEAGELIKSTGRIKFKDTVMNHHILTINKLNKNDSAEYIFRTEGDAGKWSALHGVTLVVTELKVKFTPSAEVTEGQRVTLTCRTSCPLTDNMNYIWYLNNQTVNQTKRQSKYLVLDPVSSEHAGNYSCRFKMFQRSSQHKMLTVHRKQGAQAAIGIVAILLVIIPIIVFLWIRRKKTSIQSPRTETSDNLEQMSSGHVYDDISAQPTEKEDILYSSIQFTNNTDALYSELQPHQPTEEQTPYAVVNI